MNKLTRCAIGSGICYGLWPALIRFTELPPQWVALVVSSSTLGYAAWWTITSRIPMPAPLQIAAGVAIGGLNATGLYFYTPLATVQGGEASRYLVVSATAPVVTLFLFRIIIFREPATARKFAGIAAILLGMRLLL